MYHSFYNIQNTCVVVFFLVFCFLSVAISNNRNWNDPVFVNHLRNTRWWHLYKLRISPNFPTNNLQYAFTRHQWHQFYSFDPIRRQLYSKESNLSWKNHTNLPANSDLIQITLEGIRKGIYTCQQEFRTDRWNCPTPNYNNPSALLFGDIMLKGLRQTAFIYAMLSASLVQTVAEACSNRLPHCPCNNKGRTPQKNWIWQGCDDNVHFARRFARKMFDPSHADWHKKSLMDLHNTGVGRRLVVQSMQIKCVCQGTSGSCTTKICHRKVASIEEIGRTLKEKFENAVKVIRDKSYYQLLDVNNQKTRGNKNLKYRKGLIKFTKSTNGKFAKSYPPQRDLVYLEDVADDFFCESKPELHLKGTKNRLCSTTSNSTDNCDQLCCGRRYVSQSSNVTEKCHCKFIWCCRVKCQQCHKSITVETCQ
uniref:Protein Wnt n=1 Tax=Dendrocoelum lacteum TaxID=27895 RepID=T1DF63_9PLAT